MLGPDGFVKNPDTKPVHIDRPSCFLTAPSGDWIPIKKRDRVLCLTIRFARANAA